MLNAEPGDIIKANRNNVYNQTFTSLSLIILIEIN